jgi:hypothetical protein
MFDQFIPHSYFVKIATVTKSIFLAVLAVGLVYWVAAFLLGVELFTF